MNIVNSFLFFVLIPLLLNIEMKTNNYSNLALLYASKHKNWNYQIHSYSRINKNEKKIFLRDLGPLMKLMVFGPSYH